MGDGWAVALSSAAWLAVSLLVGWRAARWPPDRLGTTGPVTTLRPWEDGGRWWQRHVGVRRWKDRLPEAGALFTGGRSKRHLATRSTRDLDQFRRETVRAERVHWLIMASTPVHLVWCRPAVATGMAAYGLFANLPFIVVQRYNRGRVDRLLSKR